jgi:hypothetical protein
MIEWFFARPRGGLRRSGWLWLCAGLGLAAVAQAGEGAAGTNVVLLASAEMQRARTRFQSETNSVEAAWQLGRACFEWAGLLKDPSQIEKLAHEGIAACRLALTNDPACAPAHYYLGLDLGRLAGVKRNLAALWMVREMEREFKRARELDEQFNFAGPDRTLGLLYAQAPVIGSIGSRRKARQHLRRAVELAPGYPDNRLNLLEACFKWDDPAGARHELEALEQSWAAARQHFAGEQWASSWQAWELRLNRARQKLAAGKAKEE